MKFLITLLFVTSTTFASPYDICTYEIIATDGGVMKVTESGLWTEAACEEIAIRKLKNQEGEFDKLIIKYGKEKKVKKIDVKDIKMDARGDYYL